MEPDGEEVLKVDPGGKPGRWVYGQWADGTRWRKVLNLSNKVEERWEREKQLLGGPEDGKEHGEWVICNWGNSMFMPLVCRLPRQNMSCRSSALRLAAP